MRERAEDVVLRSRGYNSVGHEFASFGFSLFDIGNPWSDGDTDNRMSTLKGRAEGGSIVNVGRGNFNAFLLKGLGGRTGGVASESSDLVLFVQLRVCKDCLYDLFYVSLASSATSSSCSGNFTEPPCWPVAPKTTRSLLAMLSFEKGAQILLSENAVSCTILL